LLAQAAPFQGIAVKPIFNQHNINEILNPAIALKTYNKYRGDSCIKIIRKIRKKTNRNFQQRKN